MFKALNFAFINELKEIQASWYKLFIITIFPLVSFALIISIFYKGVALDLPIVVVDHDKSKLSRKLVFNVNATATLDVKYRVETTKEAIMLIKSTKAYALLEVPEHFERDIYLQTQPKVTAFLNTQFILIGKIIKAALFESVGYSAAAV